MSGTAIKTVTPFKGPRALGRAAKVAGEGEGNSPGSGEKEGTLVVLVQWRGRACQERHGRVMKIPERERRTEANGSLRLPDNANSARAHTAEKIRERTPFCVLAAPGRAKKDIIAFLTPVLLLLLKQNTAVCRSCTHTHTHTLAVHPRKRRLKEERGLIGTCLSLAVKASFPRCVKETRRGRA